MSNLRGGEKLGITRVAISFLCEAFPKTAVKRCLTLKGKAVRGLEWTATIYIYSYWHFGSGIASVVLKE